MAGHVRWPTLSKGEPEQTLRCSNAEAFFQVPAGPFRSLYPHSRHTAASEQLDFTICGTFLCSTWFPQGSRAAGKLEAGELLLMQGTESLGQQHGGKCLGRGNGSAERLARTGAPTERVTGCDVSGRTCNICTYFLCNLVFCLVGCL